MINDNNTIKDINKEKTDMVETTIARTGIDMGVEEGEGLFDDVLDAIISDEHTPHYRTIDYLNPRTNEMQTKGIFVKIAPDSALIQIRRRLKKSQRSDYFEQEVVKKYWVSKDGVTFDENKVEALPAGIINKIYKVIKEISNIDDTEERRVAAQGFADSS